MEATTVLALAFYKKFTHKLLQCHDELQTGKRKLKTRRFITRDPAEALSSYQQKDTVNKKGFDDLKNDLDMKWNAAMEGWIFIQFIALILTTYMKRIMEKNR